MPASLSPNPLLPAGDGANESLCEIHVNDLILLFFSLSNQASQRIFKPNCKLRLKI
jgi:hypothetical protein